GLAWRAAGGRRSGAGAVLRRRRLRVVDGPVTWRSVGSTGRTCRAVRAKVGPVARCLRWAVPPAPAASPGPSGASRVPGRTEPMHPTPAPSPSPRPAPRGTHRAAARPDADSVLALDSSEEHTSELQSR